MSYRIEGEYIRRLSDDFVFRRASGVPEFEQYVAWLSAGGTPEEGPDPAPVPDVLSEAQFIRAAVAAGLVTPEEGKGYLRTGDLPAIAVNALAMLPEVQRLDAELKMIGATSFYRADPLFAVLIAAGAATAEQVDDMFRYGASLT